ncbi:ribosomal large subunit pseudouridine synthase B [Nitzschia inconspicua]|uniref:Phosphatidate cytidylyltransferase, mitochondrial n=1 Tax=Nitzschia inconspicua TaxID=303405 RepID=A0A9K3PN02_9STRA|nr:ribosomal large subunit pseudouridine synthase B [Nitzschia inconspicua]
MMFRMGLREPTGRYSRAIAMKQISCCSKKTDEIRRHPPQSHRFFSSSSVASSGDLTSFVSKQQYADTKNDGSSSSSSSSMNSIRLSKLLSHHAVNLSISRRQAEKLIQSSQVTIAGQVVQNSASVVNMGDIRKSSSSSSIKVKGKAVQLDWDSLGGGDAAEASSSGRSTTKTATAVPKVWAVHKVAGEVVAENDPQGRPSMIERLRHGGVGQDVTKSNQKHHRQWHLKPIGRLDMPTEGLILVTNDGSFAREMELPSSALHRVYRARVHGRLTPHKLDRIRKGGIVHKNVKYGPMKVAVERQRKGTSSSTNTWLQVTCTEGKNRQIRNVFAALGMTVTRLIRIGYGDYRLDTIPKGMAIPVPYKPVERQRAKGAFAEKLRLKQRHHNDKRAQQASPIKWINSVQVRSMATYAPSQASDEGQLTSQQVLQDNVVSLFPKDHLVYCFGYGSGVFSQTLKDATRKHEGMLDLILVVNDTTSFHEANMKVFPHHYAPWLRWGGPSLATKVQRHFPLSDAHVLFHVVDDPVPMKYGVVDQQDLVHDLINWDTLYLSGRLHKPTLALVDPPPDWFLEGQHQNLRAATSAALLLMGPIGKSDRTWETFCRNVASLSYTGDFRMQVGGEDPQKLNKLVAAPGQMLRFQQIYRPYLERFETDDAVTVCSDAINWDDSNPDTLDYFQSHLPASIKDHLPIASNANHVAAALSAALAARVAPAARHQSLKGIATLGLGKSLQYASAKLSKGLFASKSYGHQQSNGMKRNNNVLFAAATATSFDGTVLGPRLPINDNFPGLEKIHSNPDIFVIRNFLSPRDCQDLIDRATEKKLERSPVAYAGWTEDFKDLVELAAKGPVAWVALVTAWLQVKGDDSASQVYLVVHALQNYAVVFLLVTALIAAFTYSRAEGLKNLRTSTSTTLDDLSDPSSGTRNFVRQAAKLFLEDSSVSSMREEAALFEAPTVIRYEADQVLAPHYDANRSAETEDANRGGQTLATLLVYLNDVEQGGLTRFGKLKASDATASTPKHNSYDDDQLVIQPKLGDALLFFPADRMGTFDPRTEHEGMSAIDEKWIARIWRHKQRVPPPFGLSEEALDKI